MQQYVLELEDSSLLNKLLIHKWMVIFWSFLETIQDTSIFMCCLYWRRPNKRWHRRSYCRFCKQDSFVAALCRTCVHVARNWTYSVDWKSCYCCFTYKPRTEDSPGNANLISKYAVSLPGPCIFYFSLNTTYEETFPFMQLWLRIASFSNEALNWLIISVFTCVLPFAAFTV